MAIPTRIIAYAGLIAAAYVVFTLAVAPIAYGPIQLRVSELLKPVALFHPAFALAFLVGNGLANIPSPFGIWDWGVMPFVDCAAALLCWQMRRFPIPAVLTQAAVISAGVAAFPLGIAGGFPFWPTFGAVLLSEAILLVTGYLVIWRTYGAYLFSDTRTHLLRGRQ